MDAKRGGETIQRKYLPPRRRFEVTLTWPASLPLERKRGIVAALWLATWLGGMGSRSRRGFGSMRVTEVKDPGNEALGELPFTFQGDSQQLHDFLETNLRRCAAWIGRGTPPDGTSLPDYSVLHPKFAKLYLWKTPFRDWERAMDEAGTRMMKFRRRYPLNRPGNPWGDYQEVKKFLQHPSKRIGPIRRTAFGLPIEFYFTSLPRGSNKASVKGKTQERRGSPLFVRVVRLGDRKYGLLFLLLRAEILPEGEPIMIQARSEKGFGPQPDFSAVEEFLDENVVPEAWEVSV
ncbi:MAG: hypothetical protein D6812_09020 [Deltaproteobacteria bacterium]|nr:MAG: hypothetical protein D6812_09020 [Deltaproteobacteria bacterium]